MNSSKKLSQATPKPIRKRVVSIQPLNLIRFKPLDLSQRPRSLPSINLFKPVKTMLEIYTSLRDSNIRFIKSTLQQHFPDRWDIKVTESLAANVMFTELEEKYKACTNTRKKELVNSWMTSLLSYTHESPYHSVVLRETLLTIIIHFPHLHITNADGRQHDIEDLYVKLRMSPLFTTTGGDNLFMGLRTSMWYKEMGSNYCFSHLSGKTEEARAGRWTSFCLGSTDFSIMCQDMRTQFDRNRFELLCIQLPDYLSWESLEGRPHRYMHNISEASLFDTSSSGAITGAEADAIVQSILRKEPNVPTKLAKGGVVHSILINSGEEFEELVTRNTDMIKHLNIWDPVAKRASSIRLDVKASEIDRIRRESQQNGALFQFRGAPVHFKVLDTVLTAAPVTGPFRAKRDVVELVTKKFNNKFTETIRNEFNNKRGTYA